MKPIYYHKYNGGFWFRIFGKGLSVRNRKIHAPLFSERNGYIKVLRIGKWAITYLSIILLSMLLVGCGKEEPKPLSTNWNYKDGQTTLQTASFPTNIVIGLRSDGVIVWRDKSKDIMFGHIFNGREQQIQMMTEAFERAIRNTGLDKKDFNGAIPLPFIPHSSSGYPTNTIIHLQDNDDMPEFYKERVKSSRAYTNSCYIP